MDVTLKPGDRAQYVGLQDDSKLNGAVVILESYDEIKNKWSVTEGDGANAKAHPSNLEFLERCVPPDCYFLKRGVPTGPVKSDEPSVATEDKSVLPDGWTQHTGPYSRVDNDPASGRTYYAHEDGRPTQWERPSNKSADTEVQPIETEVQPIETEVQPVETADQPDESESHSEAVTHYRENAYEIFKNIRKESYKLTSTIKRPTDSLTKVNPPLTKLKKRQTKKNPKKKKKGNPKLQKKVKKLKKKGKRKLTLVRQRRPPRHGKPKQRK